MNGVLNMRKVTNILWDTDDIDDIENDTTMLTPENFPKHLIHHKSQDY